MTRVLAPLLALTLVAGCERMGEQGPAGPSGPEGPQGPPGSSGAATTVLYATFDAEGSAVASLPAEAGSDPDNPPLVACYMREPATPSVWIVVGDGRSNAGAYCGIGVSGGRWRIAIIDGPPGWEAAFVVAFNP